MSFIKIDPLNNAGKEILQLYKLYHSCINRAEKEQILDEACRKFRNIKAIKKAFLGNFQGELYYELCQTAMFSSDVAIVKEMTPFVEDYLQCNGIDRVELSPFRRPGRTKESTLSIERRIGIKAKQLEEVNELSVKNSRSFFRDGHAEAFLTYIVIPQLKKLLKNGQTSDIEYIDLLHQRIDRNKPEVQILFTIASTRSYLENIRVQFLIPFEAVTRDSQSLDYVIEKIKLLDQYELEHPILF